MTIVSFWERLNFWFGLTYLNLPQGRIGSALEGVEEDAKVDEVSPGGRVPKRDLTGFFRVVPLGRAVAVAGQLPRRALIPVVALTGELVGVLVGEDVLDLLGE